MAGIYTCHPVIYHEQKLFIFPRKQSWYIYQLCFLGVKSNLDEKCKPKTV
jgi:hypothetical protein